MQSKKRYRETFIWEAEWFMKLSSHEKLLWFYINDRCDNIGVWEPNMTLAQIHVSGEIDIDRFFSQVNEGKERLIKRPGGSWFITGFVKFQFASHKPLNPKNPAHYSYLELIKERGLWEWFLENQPHVVEKGINHKDFLEDTTKTLEGSNKSTTRTLEGPSEDSKEKEEDKEKEIEKEKELSVNGKTTNVDKAINTDGSLKYFKIVKELKKIIPSHAIDCTDKEMESDLENLLFAIKTEGIDNPKTFLVAKAKTTDWKIHSWDDFYELLQDAVEEGAPF